MKLETSIEKKAVALASQQGCILKKVGLEGWPDRILLLGSGQHVWIEFKQPGGKLRPAQRVVMNKLRKMNDMIHVVTNADDILDIIYDARIGA